jgi:dTDP-4-dehydrorhamnose reductase
MKNTDRKNVLITGANGLLGQALIDLFRKDYNVLATGVEENAFLPVSDWEYNKLDITRYKECEKIVQTFSPSLILNAASYTDVDRCESEKEFCWEINVKGVENLAKISDQLKIHLIHYSTDYIFNGENGPYDENDKTSPLGYYGKSKLAAENVLTQIGCPCSILRTCVLYGAGVNVKKNFFLWILENLEDEKQIHVVTDQYNNPTLAEDLAEGSKLAFINSAYGVYHIAGLVYINRYDFALKVAQIFNLREDLINPIETAQLKQLAKRPMKGGLKIDLAQKKLYYNPHSLEETLLFLEKKLNYYGDSE